MSKPEAQSENPAPVAYLDQALWRRFRESESLEEFASAWLVLQCSMINAVRAGVVVLESEAQRFVPVAGWPEHIAASPLLAATTESAIERRKGCVNKAEQHACAAYPLLVDDRLLGVVGLEFDHANDALLRTSMRHLQWGCGWFETYLRRTAASPTLMSGGDASLAVEFAGIVLEARRFHEAATALCTDLARRYDCDRVCLGLRDGKHARVVAISHSAEFGKSSNMVRATAAAMDEAIDQYAVVCYPESDGQVRIDRAHAVLASHGKSDHVLTIPILDAGETFGALTFDGFDWGAQRGERVASIGRVAAFLGPMLAAKHRDDQWIGRKILESAKTQLQRLFGADYVGRKFAALAGFGVLVFLLFATDTYRVQATATIEGAVERVAVAAIPGYIIEANVRAGDIVAKDDQLFRIDDRDLRLEYLRWSSQKEQILRQQRDAFAQHERSEVNILSAQLDQAESQLTLIEEQIARTRGVAPFDGIIVSGDLSNELGAPVERGQVLFKIAPLDEYRVSLEVAETDIADVAVGQRGDLVLAADPDQVLEIAVESITPVSTAANGVNTFRLEASLAETPAFLRPGMQGAARIDIDERKLAWIWTHELVEWLRFRAWSWWP